ncbi:hypothetical protein LCGC14_2736100, partial [marine sediment metagenome]
PMVKDVINALPVLSRVKGAKLVTIMGGSHTGFSDSAKYLRWFENPDSIGCAQVLKALDIDEEEPWYTLLGSQEQGVIYETPAPLCTMQPLPVAMNPLRQHMITKVAILSFFQSHFADTAEEKKYYSEFLSKIMAKELPEVIYQESAM